jgi:hypothetical protein
MELGEANEPDSGGELVLDPLNDRKLVAAQGVKRAYQSKASLTHWRALRRERHVE